MPEIRIRRDHHFGLAKAREIAWQWAEDVERDFEMTCTVIEGDDEDVVEFSRTGVSGTLTVNGKHFDLDARLGLLLGAFSKTIKEHIEGRLDELLGSAGAPAAKAAKAGASAKAEKAVKAEKPAGRKKK